MTKETIEALRRIEAQLARLTWLEGWIKARRSMIEVNEYGFLLARCERAKEKVASSYNLLLIEHRLAAASRQPSEIQLSLF